MKNHAVLIQHAYKGRGFEPLLELTRERNQAYCDAFKFDYLCEISDGIYPYTDGAWEKINLILQSMKHYSEIVWLDADAMIYDMTVDLRDAIQGNKIGACWHRIPQLHHWNVGVLYISTTYNTEQFCKEWLASYPAPRDGWLEQGVFNRLGMKSKTVVTLSDKWNATLNVNMVPDAVVLGFHGIGGAKERLALMRDALKVCNGAKETA